LQAYKGIVVGQFTDSRPDLNYPSTADMLRERLPLWGVKDVPVAFNFPCGHIDGNLPLIEGAKARLQVEASLTTLTMQQPAS
jgi:muramoyltetrapeptide carboxypeptidase LdcA involved in peptidoglycan recycling